VILCTVVVSGDYASNFEIPINTFPGKYIVYYIILNSISDTAISPPKYSKDVSTGG
jgi:hypothetical protein